MNLKKTMALLGSLIVAITIFTIYFKSPSIAAKKSTKKQNISISQKTETIKATNIKPTIESKTLSPKIEKEISSRESRLKKIEKILIDIKKNANEYQTESLLEQAFSFAPQKSDFKDFNQELSEMNPTRIVDFSSVLYEIKKLTVSNIIPWNSFKNNLISCAQNEDNILSTRALCLHTLIKEANNNQAPINLDEFDKKIIKMAQFFLENK